MLVLLITHVGIALAFRGELSNFGSAVCAARRGSSAPRSPSSAPGPAAIISTVGPVSTILLAYFFLQGPFSLTELAGTALVIPGATLMATANIPKPTERTPQT